ncbi:hypothetical protein C2G38_2129172 [Gigaspora rosea]|uniref:Uncharacterized protein n=1 Tax=Gigaspora rosea TaxID=44941 RepID=A0A397TV35_9GLOM|nr:hypothetical protein C2G38_2129172 [Gigaspora rosea]
MYNKVYTCNTSSDYCRVLDCPTLKLKSWFEQFWKCLEHSNHGIVCHDHDQGTTRIYVTRI